MNVIFLLLPLSTFLATVFLVLFIRAVRSGQYDDIEDAGRRMLEEDG